MVKCAFDAKYFKNLRYPQKATSEFLILSFAFLENRNILIKKKKITWYLLHIFLKIHIANMKCNKMI